MDRQERSLVEQLLALGVRPGGVVVVHTAFSRIGPIDGGPAALIAALVRTLGPAGTLVMPSMSDDDEHPFDVRATPCRGMGIVADTFWRMPGVWRSDSPHSFAAIGPHAEAITAPHPPDVPHGLDSPIGRVWQLAGQVLLLGVGHDANTTIHLAENMAAVRYGIAKRLVLSDNGRVARVEYLEIDHCCGRFAQMDRWLGERDLQHRGHLAHGTARLAHSRDVVEMARTRLRHDETIFLHTPGQCAECDESRQAIPR